MAEYIEREGVKKSINFLFDIRLNVAHEIKQLVLDLIDDERAADVQPVKRGRWIAENRDSRGYADCYTCTNCNCYSYTYTLMKDCEYEYCPNCGARMDGDKGNNVRNLTDEETTIYESWIESEAKDTGVNIMDGDTE